MTTDAEAATAALVGARLAGCTCDPAVEIERDAEPLLMQAHIQHDDTCHLLQRLRSPWS